MTITTPKRLGALALRRRLRARRLLQFRLSSAPSSAPSVRAGVLAPRNRARLRPPPHLSGTVNIDGSSTVYPITEAVAEEFQKANPGVKVTVAVRRHRWRVQEVLQRRDRHERRLAPDQGRRRRRRRQACKAKSIDYVELGDRHRRPVGRRQPGEHLGRPA